MGTETVIKGYGGIWPECGDWGDGWIGPFDWIGRPIDEKQM